MYTPFVCLLTFCCVIIRCDTLVMFAPFLLFMLMTGRMSFIRIAVLGISTGCLSLLLSVSESECIEYVCEMSCDCILSMGLNMQ